MSILITHGAHMLHGQEEPIERGVESKCRGVRFGTDVMLLLLVQVCRLVSRLVLLWTLLDLVLHSRVLEPSVCNRRLPTSRCDR